MAPPSTGIRRRRRPVRSRCSARRVLLTAVSLWLLLLMFFVLRWNIVPTAIFPRASRPIVLLSNASCVTVTTDVKGNLGPASVLLDPNGTHWLKDRWQAAKDMHGSEIKGAHWVKLDFSASCPPPREITAVILDWETAFSDDYRLIVNPDEEGSTLIDTRNEQQRRGQLRTEKHGLSPGVPKLKLPLHVVHTWKVGKRKNVVSLSHPVRSIQLEIRRPFHNGWGVSLWSIQIYGRI